MKEILLRQLEVAWSLAAYHLEGLTTAECLWRPAEVGPHVWRGADGVWRADWPEHEGYDLGPPSVGWTTWHIGFWWSMAIDHAFGDGRLTREAVAWPGEADAVRGWIGGLHARWRDEVGALDDAALAATERCRWPIEGRPFADVVAWANLELMKNAAELGYLRFLHGARRG